MPWFIGNDTTEGSAEIPGGSHNRFQNFIVINKIVGYVFILCGVTSNSCRIGARSGDIALWNMAYCINVLELQIFMAAYRSEILKLTYSFVQREYEEEVGDLVLKCHFLCMGRAANCVDCIFQKPNLTLVILANFPSRITGKSKVVLK
jgi:hypothetical protein